MGYLSLARQGPMGYPSLAPQGPMGYLSFWPHGPNTLILDRFLDPCWCKLRVRALRGTELQVTSDKVCSALLAAYGQLPLPSRALLLDSLPPPSAALLLLAGSGGVEARLELDREAPAV